MFWENKIRKNSCDYSSKYNDAPRLCAKKCFEAYGQNQILLYLHYTNLQKLFVTLFKNIKIHWCLVRTLGGSYV